MSEWSFSVLSMAAALAIAACTNSTVTPVPSVDRATPASAAPSVAVSAVPACVVGVSWNDYTADRWAAWDEPAIKAALAAGGASYISDDAGASAERQAGNIEDLIARGATVVILVAQDGIAIRPAVTAALRAGVTVLAYDRLIENSDVLYVSFDNALSGKLQAEAALARVPAGRFAIIKGDRFDANGELVRSGYVQAGIPATGQKDATGRISIIGETYTESSDPAKAQAETTQILASNGNKVGAILAENDGLAAGVVASLSATGLGGQVPVFGQDGDAAGLNRVALGTQAVDVWRDTRLLGRVAGESAVALCANHDPTKISGIVQFASPAGSQIPSILLQPRLVTRDNLNMVVDGGWVTSTDLCKGVPAGAVGVCG